MTKSDKEMPNRNKHIFKKIDGTQYEFELQADEAVSEKEFSD